MTAKVGRSTLKDVTLASMSIWAVLGLQAALLALSFACLVWARLLTRTPLHRHALRLIESAGEELVEAQRRVSAKADDVLDRAEEQLTRALHHRSRAAGAETALRQKREAESGAKAEITSLEAYKAYLESGGPPLPATEDKLGV